MSTAHPQIVLQPGKHKRVKLGHPWIYANEVVMTSAVKALPPGSLVTVVNGAGEPLGTAFFSAHTPVVARQLTTTSEAELCLTRIDDERHHPAYL